MALDFPSSPSNGQKYFDYVYDSSLPGWRNVNTTDANTLVQVGLVPVVPTSVTVGSGTSSTSANGAISFSGVSSISLNGCFSSAYSNYRLVFSQLVSTNSTAYLTLRLRSAGTDRSNATYYRAGWATYSDGSAAAQWNADAQTMLYVVHNSYTGGYSGAVELYAPFVVTTETNYSFSSTGQAAGGQVSSVVGNGLYASENSNDGISLITTAGTMTGTLQVYGYR